MKEKSMESFEKEEEKKRKKNTIETRKMKLILNEMHWGESK